MRELAHVTLTALIRLLMIGFALLAGNALAHQSPAVVPALIVTFLLFCLSYADWRTL